MRATSDAAAAVRTLIAALPDACLRDLCIQLALNRLTLTPPSPAQPEARRKGGWPRGRRRTAANGRRRGKKALAKGTMDSKLAERRARYAAARKAKRHAAKAAKATKATTNNGNGESVAASPQAFWQHAEKLEPTRPWRAVVREFDVKEALAQNCYRKLSLPPGVGPMAVTKFLSLQAS
jgi:hypothetical protein